MKEVYPVRFYKYLTEKKVNEGEDWDIQCDEFDEFTQAYEDYKDYVNGLYLILKDLKAKGLEDSLEFKKTAKEFEELTGIEPGFE